MVSVLSNSRDMHVIVIALILQVNQLFDNGGTVFFAIVMSFWGKVILICVHECCACTLCMDFSVCTVDPHLSEPLWARHPSYK